MTQADQKLILILGDQLTPHISSLRGADKSRDCVVMVEAAGECTVVRHHKKKIVLVLSAMRHFAQELRKQGWNVVYVPIDSAANSGDLAREVAGIAALHPGARVVATEPGDFRLAADLRNSDVELVEDDRFICSHATFNAWAKGRKELRMEFFYRDMRRQTGLLMHGDTPEGDRWNFDSENRKAAAPDMFMPQPKQFVPDAITEQVIETVGRLFPDAFGELLPFWFAVTPDDANRALQHFLQTGLPQFGETQDAMLQAHRFLHHSLLSAYINIGLLDPLHVCKSVEEAFRKGRVPLASAEGFIRQIIGWREFIRGVYWLKMPDYVNSNALAAMRPLPGFYWSGRTQMNCMAHVVQQTREEAYAHHIQRLMITGNFALLAGLNPREVHEWYLAVYIDAFDWVEMPNTIGMALHADGGVVGSKPYAASGNYIHRMSDYCGACTYDVKQRTGDKACPFNALYWDFIARHAERFKRNPRMAQACRSFERFDEAEQKRIRTQAKAFLESLTSEY